MSVNVRHEGRVKDGEREGGLEGEREKPRERERERGGSDNYVTYLLNTNP